MHFRTTHFSNIIDTHQPIFPRSRSLIVYSIAFLSTIFIPQTIRADETRSSIGFHCLHNFKKTTGSTQGCLNLYELQLLITKQVSKSVRTVFRLDPFGTTSRSYEGRPISPNHPSIQKTDLLFVDFYSIDWKFRDHLTLSLQEYGGATQLPSFSGLSLASHFQHSGWDQIALVASYKLLIGDGVNVNLIIGNGEGELFKNLDPQQYGALDITGTLTTGWKLKLGFSIDGNNAGNIQNSYYRDNFSVKKTPFGFSTTRIGLAFFLDGQWPEARGLKLSLGWQQASQKDLNKKINFTSDEYIPDNSLYGIDALIIEDTSQIHANTFTRQVININASYQILGNHYLGLDYETLAIDGGKVFYFTDCHNDINTCDTSRTPSQSLEKSAYSMGIGLALAEGLNMVLEYRESSYAKIYRKFHYTDDKEEISRHRDLFNARFALNW